MPDEIEKAFVKSFIKFLNTKIAEPGASEIAESLEVAVQCLEAGFELNPEAPPQDGDQPTTDSSAGLNAKSFAGVNLYELFQSAFVDVTAERKAQAEEIKNQGNRLMKDGKYNEALNNYNKAISLDATNPVYYCNRAAAYIRLSEFEKGIADCKQALVYNPNYSKAHGRMGIAYSNMQKYDQARESYRRALELEPDNQDMQNNLRICEQRLDSTASSNAPPPGTQNIANILQNTLQALPLENADLRQLIMDMLNDPMISMAHALELDPDNVELQNRLRMCHEHLASAGNNSILSTNVNMAHVLQNTLQNLPVENTDLRQLIVDMLNDPMISMASRQLVMQVAQEYPDVITGFRQQLMDFANVRANDGTPPAPATGATPGTGGTGAGGEGQTNVNRSSQNPPDNTAASNNTTNTGQQQPPSPGNGGSN